MVSLQAFLSFLLRAPKFLLPLLTPVTQAIIRRASVEITFCDFPCSSPDVRFVLYDCKLNS